VSEQALYLSEGEIARRVLGKAHAEAWPDIVRVLERDRGFPPINSVIGMRYWPGVVKWFEQYEKVDSLSPGRHSGKELPCQPGRGRLASSAKPTKTAQIVSLGSRAQTSESSDTNQAS